VKKLVVLIVLAAIAWQGYGKLNQQAKQANLDAPPMAYLTENPAATSYRCDGRTYCSQMTSCAEATWFLKNCPGTKMDGDNDGIPCERQWCK
jgi:hypothetical protein